MLIVYLRLIAPFVLNFYQDGDESRSLNNATAAVVEVSSTTTSAIDVRQVHACAVFFVSHYFCLFVFFDLIASLTLMFCQACDESRSFNSTAAAVVEVSSMTTSAITV